MVILIVLAFVLLVLFLIYEDRRQQKDPLRPILNNLAGRVSASCDYSNHYQCGYPGPLFFSKGGRCECPCHSA